ncbi:MAG: alpha-amylase family glycosyl hydrolase [Planctomycetota bacterium]
MKLGCFALSIVCFALPVGLVHAFPGAPVDIRDEVFYQIMPIAWRDSNNDAQRFGDFGGMTASLDYLQGLGVTAIWMTPIFPSPAYHGYQHGPADQLNPWFGTEAEFLNFVQQAHSRGIKLFVDFVVYGISHNSTWFQSAVNNPASPYDGWLAFTNAANSTYLGSVYTTWNGSTVGHIHWDLRNSSPVGLDTDWARHWLDPNNDGDPSDGIDGFRLDHVWENYGSGPDGWGYNLDDFWMPWKAALKAVNPAVITFAEQADWGITGATLMPAFDSTFTKPWEFAARDALANELSANLYSSTASTLAQMPAGRTFLGILGDHDVDRLTSIVGGNLTRAKAGAAILMTAPFTPIVYFGDEIGMVGTKGNYGSDANDIPMREPFKWNSIAGSPMSNYFVLNSQAYMNRFSQNNDGRSVQEQNGVAGSLLETYKLLIAARKNNVALRHGAYVPVTNNSTRVWSFLRHAAGEQTLLVAIRVRSGSSTTTFNLSNTVIPGGSTTVRDILSGQFLANLTDANKAAYGMTLGDYAFRILEVNLSPALPPPSEIDGAMIPTDLGRYSLVASQNTPAFGDNIYELDQLFLRPRASDMRIGVTGNTLADGTGFALFIDSVAGGQSVLDFSGFVPPPSGPNALTGLQFDAGFAPDHLIYVNIAGGTIYVDQFVLPTGGPASKTYRGQGTMNDGDGLLTGGVNPNGMQVAMTNTNTQGITADSVDSVGTASTGFDMLVPYGDVSSVGLGGSVKVAAFVLQGSGQVMNQWLPGLGGPHANLGLSPDMTAVPGDQFATVALRLPADINADHAVDSLDIAAFVDVVLGLDSDSNRQAASDLNRDGMADGADVQFFTEAYRGG